MLIRDPVHGDIALGPAETAVLDFPEVQRLRGIKQLGTANLVYPGATHTRFDHSLGASDYARRIVASLRAHGTPIDADLETAIVTATLLHDVTHLPFGHTLEDERNLFPRHDKGERWNKMVEAGLGARLERIGLRQSVASILGSESQTSVPPWAKQIVSSTIDADLLDYLRRDAFFTGLAQGYDDRIFHYFVIADGQLAIDMTKHGMERPDARSETIQLLRMRYFLTERVYYHHTKVAAGAMISKAVEMAQEHGAFGEDELMGLNDWTLLARLRDRAEAGGDRRIASMIDRLERRALLKRGYVISARTVPDSVRRALVERYHFGGQRRLEAEQRIAETVGCDAADVIVYCPALTVMKEAAALVRTPHGLLKLNDSERSPSLEIQALESRYAALWRFYVFVPEEYAGAVAGPAREIFGPASELTK